MRKNFAPRKSMQWVKGLSGESGKNSKTEKATRRKE